MPKKYYEIRQGDGNQGCYYLTTLSANDIEQALRKVQRRGLINLKPYWRRQLVIDGDETHIDLCLYPVRNDNQDYCPYVMTITEIDEETMRYNRTQRNY